MSSDNSLCATQRRSPSCSTPWSARDLCRPCRYSGSYFSTSSYEPLSSMKERQMSRAPGEISRPAPLLGVAPDLENGHVDVLSLLWLRGRGRSSPAVGRP